MDKFDDHDVEQEAAKLTNELSLIEVKYSIDARAELGRLTTSPRGSKRNFIDYLR